MEAVIDLELGKTVNRVLRSRCNSLWVDVLGFEGPGILRSASLLHRGYQLSNLGWFLWKKLFIIDTKSVLSLLPLVALQLIQASKATQAMILWRVALRLPCQLLLMIGGAVGYQFQIGMAAGERIQTSALLWPGGFPRIHQVVPDNSVHAPLRQRNAMTSHPWACIGRDANVKSCTS